MANDFNEFLTQEEIDMIMKANEDVFDEIDIDIIGEVGNMSMGVAATALSAFLGNVRTAITTPVVDVISYEDIFRNVSEDSVVAKIDYIRGIGGSSLLMLSKESANIISNLGAGNRETFEILSDDTLLSTIGEVLNQMMGSSSTALSKVIHEEIHIGIPSVMFYSRNSGALPYVDSMQSGQNFIKITFKLKVDRYIDSMLMLIFDMNSAKYIVDIVKEEQFGSVNSDSASSFDASWEFFNKLLSPFSEVLPMFGLSSDLKLDDVYIVKHYANLGAEILNNFSIINDADSSRIGYAFSRDFMESIKKSSMVDTTDEVIDVIKELNNQLINAFINNFSEKNIYFRNVFWHNYLEVPEDEYVIVKYSLDRLVFYCICSAHLFAGSADKKEQIPLVTSSAFNPSNVSFEKKLTDKEQKPESAPEPAVNPFARNDIRFAKGQLENGSSPFKRVPFKVYAVIDTVQMTVRELIFLNTGSMLTLKRKYDEDIDIYINGVKKAEGEVLQVVDDKNNYYAVEVKKIKKE